MHGNDDVYILAPLQHEFYIWIHLYGYATQHIFKNKNIVIEHFQKCMKILNRLNFKQNSSHIWN